MLQKLFETYSSLSLSFQTDRVVAISGLQRRLEKSGFGAAPYGLFCNHYRSLLWQRRGGWLQRIKYPAKRTVPSWSWMAYYGEIQYVNIPSQGMEWLSRSQELGKDLRWGSSALSITVNNLSHQELSKELWRLSFDDPDSVELQDVMCVVLARHRDGESGTVEYYVILVVLRFYKGYQRVGLGRLLERHLKRERQRLEGFLV